MKILKNATKHQIIYLWICVMVVVLSALINETAFIICGLFFIYSVFAIELWNNDEEKQQLKRRIKELENSQSD